MTLIDWIDLPNDNYIAVLGYETPKTLELNSLIQKYNLIPKDQISTLSCRIRKLDKIISLVDCWIENNLSPIDKKKHLLWISEIALKKRNYLSLLLDIYEKDKHSEEAQKNYHFDISGLRDKTAQPVYLNNHRFFSLKMKEYWGDFWYETLDPCHRRLTPFLDQWRAIKKTNPGAPHFFLWLETQHLPKYVPRVIYLDGEELERRMIVIKNGQFWEHFNHEWEPANFNVSSKRYLFSINLQGEIFAAEDGIGISHSSFTCGKPILGAGLLEIHKGILTSLALESGHYMPSTKIGYQILKIFENKGAHFPEKFDIVFFYDRNKYKAVVSQDDFTDFEKFKLILELACRTKKESCHEKLALI